MEPFQQVCDKGVGLYYWLCEARDKQATMGADLNQVKENHVKFKSVDPVDKIDSLNMLF